jgi:cell wall-associated NlpC family hydrolase
MDVTRLFSCGQFVVALALCAALTLPALAQAASAPPAKENPAAAVAPLLGTPYRDDGVDDPAGRHTLFANQTATFPDRGLNCSGFVVTASRAILGRELPLEAMRRDRKGDSGPGVPAGEDWDFGYDLILNVTDGLPRRLLLPAGQGQPPAPEAMDAARFRGFPLHDTAAWAAVLPRVMPGEVVYAALSKTIKGRLFYYHVGLLYADAGGKVRFAHATPGRGSHELVLTEPAGLAAFRKAFAEKTFGEKWILLVAVPLPR